MISVCYRYLVGLEIVKHQVRRRENFNLEQLIPDDLGGVLPIREETGAIVYIIHESIFNIDRIILLHDIL